MFSLDTGYWPTGYCSSVFKRKTEGSVLCASCGVLVGVNDPECYNCGRRNPGLWGFGPALRALGNDLGFVNIVTAGTVIMYVLSLVMSRDGNQIGLSPKLGGAARPRREWRVAGVRVRLVVDSADGRMAARRHPAHLLQRAVDSSAGPGDRESLWRRADDPDLHGGGHHRLYVEHDDVLLVDSFFRRGTHRRRVSLDFRISWRVGALRPAHRQQPHRPGRHSVRGLHGHHGLRLSGRRQRRTPWRISSAGISRR